MVVTSGEMGDAGVNKNPSQGKFKAGTTGKKAADKPANRPKVDSYQNPLQTSKVKRKNNGQNSSSKRS